MSSVIPTCSTIVYNQFSGISGWVPKALEMIHKIVFDTLHRNNVCHVMLTGGRSAKYLYEAWSASAHDPSSFSGIIFYFSDERCVPPDHPESNYRLAIEALFPKGIPGNVRLHRMEGDRSDKDCAADRYAAALPDRMDLLLLSIGEDGHIASLFPHSAALNETHKRVLAILGPKPPYQRLTITPPVIRNARHVLVMALGQQKRAIYSEALNDPRDIAKIPARLALDRTWIFGG